jgi:hypothetical protein
MTPDCPVTAEDGGPEYGDDVRELPVWVGLPAAATSSAEGGKESATMASTPPSRVFLEPSGRPACNLPIWAAPPRR